MKKRIIVGLLCGLCILGSFGEIKANAEFRYNPDSKLSRQEQIDEYKYIEKISNELEIRLNENNILYDSMHAYVNFVNKSTVSLENEFSFLAEYGLLGKEIYKFESYSSFNGNDKCDLIYYYYDPTTAHLIRNNGGIVDCVDLEINLDRRTNINDKFNISPDEAVDKIKNFLYEGPGGNFPDRIRYSYRQKDGKYEIICENKEECSYMEKYKKSYIYYVDKNTGLMYNESMFKMLGQE